MHRQEQRARWDLVDALRGVAILAMIVYHFSWDLSFLRLIQTDITIEPGWQWFARGIAGSFLVLVGIGLALAHEGRFNRAAFLRRLAKVAGAALAVTLVTFLAFPESYIFFGILHCITVSSILALPFLRAPVWLALTAAAASIVLPFVLIGPQWDHPWLDWLGLGVRDPVTNDYVPIMPWFGMVLIGVAVGKLMLRSRWREDLARWRVTGPAGRVLTWAGRQSLPIYLIHQPILLGALFGLSQVIGLQTSPGMPAFRAECEATCLQANGNAGLCRTACDCVVGRLKENGVWERVLADRVSPSDQANITEAAKICLRQSPPPAP